MSLIHVPGSMFADGVPVLVGGGRAVSAEGDGMGEGVPVTTVNVSRLADVGTLTGGELTKVDGDLPPAGWTKPDNQHLCSVTKCGLQDEPGLGLGLEIDCETTS